MGSYSLTEPSYFSTEHLHVTPQHVSVKTESSPSPDLLPANSNSLQQHYHHFAYNSHRPASHGSHHSSRQPSPPQIVFPQHPIFRFGTGQTTAFHSMPSHGHWSSGHHEPPGSSGSASSVNRYDLNLPYAMSFSDEYEDSADLADTNPGERLVRRRSSKACDQCRKSKCKCERASPNESCRNCVMLGTQCTFLGPSRKRGPPKGYIDAIEARLHQMEALIGIMLLSGDDRATTLLEDISQDPLAKAIINRVDNSPYGVKGRGRESGKGKHAQPKDDQATNELASTHPSNEWQDTVTAMLRKAVVARGGKLDTPRLPTMNISDDEPGPSAQNRQHREDLPAIVTASSSARDSSVTDHEDVDSTSPGRRQRRRIDDGSYDSVSEQSESQTSAAPASMISPTVPPDSSRLSHSPTTRSFASPVLRSVSQQSAPALSPLPRVVRRNTASSQTSGKEPPTGASSDGYASEDEDELPGALGQLSLNEEEQVRYHGKASGLYLLGTKDRIDQRNEGGIWRFPKARVWPPLPSKSVAVQNGDEPDFTGRLPPPEVQEQLVDLYFTYVHPVLPILYKRAFLENFRAFSNSSRATSPQAVGSDRSSSTPGSPLVNRHRLVSPLLLFAMFAVAARYSNSPSVLPLGSGATPPMWDAGDEYLEQAQRILDRSYASSKPETCQALLLMGYREIGIGAMAQAWTYVGMAIRMAQDLGMHRRADGWARAGFGRLFGDWELQERRRIWFACVVMDKYVSSYIGRPLMIFERDFDTLLPNEDDAEEFDDWIPHVAGQSQVPSVPGKIITCFNAAAVLSGILSMIVQAIYAVRPVCSRHGESVFLEGILDKWYHELPEHLQYEPSSSKRVPLPHILTLHMQYWCAVLLLHRPFIRNMYQARIKSPERNEDGDARAQAEKNYELSAGAANHITTIATLYTENYPLKFCPPFLCYYVFTASVMHVTSLTAFPADPQARVGLNKCMEILQVMQIVWPSAGRALELLRGSKVNDRIPVIPTQGKESMDRRKRPLDSHSHELPTVGLGYSEHLPAHHHDNYENTPHYNEHQHNPQHQPGQYISTSSLATDLQSVHSPPPTSYYRTEQRWNPEHHFENVQYAGALTTSVLPQTYSTGLVDDRTMASGQAHRGALHSPSAGHQGSSADHRYPQYWNDYSAYSQLGHNNYTPASEHAPVQATHSSPQVYLHEPYNIYNNQVRDV